MTVSTVTDQNGEPISSSMQLGPDGTNTDDPPSSPTPTPDSGSPPSPPTDPAVQTPFTHPSLQGRSSEEIEQLFVTMQAANRSQNDQLNKMHSQPATPQPVTPSPTPAQPGNEEFWTDPVGTIEKTIATHLEKAIRPFRDDLAASRSESVWDQAKQTLPQFAGYETMIRALVTQNQIVNPTLDQLQTLYYTAVGYVAQNRESLIAQGVAIPGAEAAPQPAGPPMGNAGPPQHAAASHPLPTPGGQTRLRDLDENEKRLAREWNMTHEQYLEAQQSEPMEMS